MYGDESEEFVFRSWGVKGYKTNFPCIHKMPTLYVIVKQVELLVGWKSAAPFPLNMLKHKYSLMSELPNLFTRVLLIVLLKL